MSGIEIDRKPVIFDHETDCGSDGKTCKLIYVGVNCAFCTLFLNVNNEIQQLNFNGRDFLKTDECKAAWKKAKETPPENDFNFFIERSVTNADGFQTFGCNAESKEDAFKKFSNGKCDITFSEVEVQELSDPLIEDIYSD